MKAKEIVLQIMGTVPEAWINPTPHTYCPKCALLYIKMVSELNLL